MRIADAWEWCLDWYGGYPGTVSDPKGAGLGMFNDRVLRGGCWYAYALGCRVGFRGISGPDSADNSLGFRAVLPSGQ